MFSRCPCTQEQAFVLQRDGGSRIDRPCRSAPGDVFPPGPASRKGIAGAGHAVAGIAAAGTGMAERILGQHPVGMIGRRILQPAVGGKDLFRGAADGSRGEILVEIDAMARGLAGRIKPGAIDQFKHVLFRARPRHGAISSLRIMFFPGRWRARGVLLDSGGMRQKSGGVFGNRTVGRTVPIRLLPGSADRPRPLSLSVRKYSGGVRGGSASPAGRPAEGGTKRQVTRPRALRAPDRRSPGGCPRPGYRTSGLSRRA